MSKPLTFKGVQFIGTMKFELISQTEQAAGFWLTSIALNTHQTLPVGFELCAANQPLILFQQTGQTAQFMSYCSISSTSDIAASEKEYHPWLTFPADAFDANQPLLIIASNLKMSAAFDMAYRLKSTHKLSVLLFSSDNFPFVVKPAKFIWPDFPAEAIGASTLLEDWKIRNRLGSIETLPGCYEGDWNSLIQEWQPDSDWQILNLDNL